MNKPPKKRELSEEERRECAALNAIYKAKKKTLGVTQELIAIEGLKASSQSAASHYLTGRNALNTEAAAVFSQYLQVPIRDFSPRLAKDIALMAKSVVTPSGPEGVSEQSGGYTSESPVRENSKQASIPPVARFIIWAANQGRLSAEDLSEIYRTASYLASKNAAPGGAVDLPDHLDGLAEAAVRAAEQGGNPEDLLKMVGHGLNRAQPKEGQLKDGKRKASSS
ncbi:hypothetical protein [Pseudomonas sp. EA_35y_Pfl2_R111]|uniref:hypothetical protein n=1 Tax=Pseudomonas sp. EA_35y_Pfl2_R111 TaxID=3088689 RepID=UPI0030D9A265